MKRRSLLVSLLAVGLLTPATLHAQSAKTLEKVATITLTGVTGFGDYMSVADGFLYVANTQQGTVSVVNVKTNAVIATIDSLKGVHGFTSVPSTGKGYVTVGGENAVAVIDLKTNKVLHKVPVGIGPDGITYGRKSGLVYVANHRGKTASLIDPKTDTVVGSVELGGTAEYAREDPATGLIYQNLEDTSEVVVVDPVAKKVGHRFATNPGEEPTGMAIDPKTNHLFAACGNKTLVILGVSDGKVLQSVPIGDGVDFAEFDPQMKRIYTANGSGSVTVIQQKGKNYTVAEEVPTSRGAHTLALDPKSHRVYVLHQGVVDVYQAHG